MQQGDVFHALNKNTINAVRKVGWAQTASDMAFRAINDRNSHIDTHRLDSTQLEAAWKADEDRYL